MVSIGVAFFCNMLLFLFSLEERFKSTFTIISSILCSIISFVPALFFTLAFKETSLAPLLSVLTNIVLLFLLSLIGSVNNVFQKLFLSVICLSNYTFTAFTSNFVLSLFPEKAPKLLLSIIPYLFYFVICFISGFCLYRCMHYFSGQNASFTITIATFLQLLIPFLTLNISNFLFPEGKYLTRILISCLVYFFNLFLSLSLYHAAKFKAAETQDENYHALLNSHTQRISSAVAYISELEQTKKSYNYIMSTVSDMSNEKKDTLQISEFISSKGADIQHSPILNHYCDNPFLNSVIACTAALADRAGIIFESRVSLTDDCKVSISEICLIVDEILQLSYMEATKAEKEKKISLNVSSTEENLILESVFTSAIKDSEDEKEKFVLNLETIKSIPPKVKDFYNKHIFQKKLDEILPSILKDFQHENYSGIELENTDSLISRYSGNYVISSASNSIIIRTTIHF